MAGLLQKALSLGLSGHSRLLIAPTSVVMAQSREMAARKGTRVRKAAIAKANRLKKLAKMKQEEQKKFSRFDWKKKVVDAPWMADDFNLSHSLDDVYYMKFFVHPRHSFATAIEFHRETHHPTVYNEPRAPVIVRLHLNMATDKQTKFVDKWKGIVGFPAPYESGSSNIILALCKGEEEQQAALRAGAALVGGVELIQDIQAGKLDKGEFDYIVAHNDIMSELVEIRGLLKQKFPMQKAGTLGIDIEKIVKRFVWGETYQVIKSEENPARGWFEMKIGNLDMSIEDLQANLSALLQDVASHRPAKKTSSMVVQQLIGSPPSREWFVLKDDDDSTTESEEVAEEHG